MRPQLERWLAGASPAKGSMSYGAAAKTTRNYMRMFEKEALPCGRNIASAHSGSISILTREQGRFPSKPRLSNHSVTSASMGASRWKKPIRFFVFLRIVQWDQRLRKESILADGLRNRRDMQSTSIPWSEEITLVQLQWTPSSPFWMQICV